MSSIWQTVYVFPSSTFRDMDAERDWLVKRVFPALRERLQKYRIHLVDIDLRWGVTEEEAQKDQVLDLCLQQIDECRPFFLGIPAEPALLTCISSTATLASRRTCTLVDACLCDEQGD